MQKSLTRNPCLLARLRRDQRGLTTVEYVIVLCLIAALSVALWNKLGRTVNKKLGEAHEKIEKNTVTK